MRPTDGGCQLQREVGAAVSPELLPRRDRRPRFTQGVSCRVRQIALKGGMIAWLSPPDVPPA